MKKFLILALCILTGFTCGAEDAKPQDAPQTSQQANPKPKPTATVLFAHKDTNDLYFDWYAPDPEASVNSDGTHKPTILFAFGGGFRSGCRYDKDYINWFKMLTKAGYGVVSIDYRLGLKGLKFDLCKFIKALDVALDWSVGDMFSATLYLMEHGSELGIDANNIVIAGSSAGAITALQAEYEIANRTQRAACLPEGFNYKGVMSFSGAIYCHDGGIKYKNPPCPQLLLHGTKDKMVVYKKIQLFKLCFAGSDKIAKSLRKGGYVYSIYRFEGNSHEISSKMAHTFPEQLLFLQNSVQEKRPASFDGKVRDPQIKVPDWAKHGMSSLY